METKRYKITTLAETRNKVIEIIDKGFSHKVECVNARRDGYVSFTTDKYTFANILDTIEGLYIKAECITDKYPELEVFHKTKSMSAMADATEERLMNEFKRLVEA